MSKAKKTLLGVTAYARHRGVDLKAVQVACESGRISFTYDGTKKMIDPERADIEWLENTDEKRSPKVYAQGDANGTPPFQESRAMREAFQAQITKLEFETKTGLLIERDKVKRHSLQTANVIKNSLRQIPAKIAAEIAAEVDPYKVEIILLREIDAALEELSRYADRYA